LFSEKEKGKVILVIWILSIFFSHTISSILHPIVGNWEIIKIQKRFKKREKKNESMVKGSFA
jgi:hypothetical protein